MSGSLRLVKKDLRVECSSSSQVVAKVGLLRKMAMPGFFSSASRMINSSNRDEIYVAAVPLRATKGPAQLLMSAAYSLNLSWDLQHFMVIFKPSSPPPHHQVMVYDFQPEDPENILVAVAALSGKKVSGIILVRKLEKIPKRKCWFVGYSEENATDAASLFNEKWETDLRIGDHDCRNYTEGLVEYLTGQKAVLEHLRQNSCQGIRNINS